MFIDLNPKKIGAPRFPHFGPPKILAFMVKNKKCDEIIVGLVIRFPKMVHHTTKTHKLV